MLAEGEGEMVGVELRVTEVEAVVIVVLLEVAVLVLVVLVVSTLVVDDVVVVCCAVVVLFDDEEESGQNVINRLASLSWHATWTQVSSGCLNAVLQPSESHVVPTPSQPP